MRTPISAVMVVCTLVGCESAESTIPPKPIALVGPEGLLETTVPALEARLDVLVVVDNSRSMAEEQMRLAGTLPALIEDLMAPPVDPVTGLASTRPLTDIHVGVVSTDMGTSGYRVETCADPVDGDAGALVHPPGTLVPDCEETDAAWLSHAGAPASGEDLASLARGIESLVQLGTDGCGFEQQLAAGVAAVSPENEANAGFLREDSVLLVLFLTDEDDCSVSDEGGDIFDTTRTDLGHLCLRCFNHPDHLEPVESFVETFRAVKPVRGDLLVGFIVGVPADPACTGPGDAMDACLALPDMTPTVDPADPIRLLTVCSSSGGLAFPARRMVEVARELGSDAWVASVCGDYAPVMHDLGALLRERLP